MSMPRGTKITCPECKTEGNFTMWHSINVDVNPETRDRVKSGKIFEYKCDNCGKTFNIEYRFLYHDCTNRFMIWYFPKKEYDITKEMEELNNGEVSKVFGDHFDEKIRIVDDKRGLIEKINIFEDRLNDFVIEIVKSIILEQVNDNNVEIFYKEMKDNNLHFWLSNNKGAGFPYSSYLSIMSDLEINEPKKGLIVNQNTVFEYAKFKDQNK